MAITNQFIDAALTTVYTSSGENAITTMIFCNYQDADNIPGDDTLTEADTFLSVYVVPSGDSALDSNKILHNLKIPGGETFIMDTEKFVLENGDRIICETTSPATVSVTISSIAV